MLVTGMIIPVIDGIQFGPGDPVLYLIIDALSRYPLFGKEMFCRNADELEPFIAQLKQMDIPILAVVSDKEKALVPAIKNALPGVPHQLCQIHYLGNAAKPMEDDLKALGVINNIP
ncbi:MAG: transposase [bacterium]|nr:transposase [bacterium]